MKKESVPLVAMHRAADEASALLQALGNRHRLLILCHLSEGPCSVGELAEALGLRSSTVSQHLALLRHDGLVRAKREGQTIRYSLTEGPAQNLLNTLFAIYCPKEQDPSARAN